ncbi:MAG: DNA polymerase, partial [Rothia mucilaginosa]
SSYMCGFIPTATRKLFSERMEDLAERYLWIPKDPYAQLVFQPEEDEAEPSLFSLPGEAEPVDNLRYFTQISRIIHELARLLHYEMEEHGQLKVYEEIELPLLYVLADMEQAGIAVSDALLTELHDTFSARANQAQDAARTIIGDTVQTDDGEEPLNLASVKQLQTVLFDKLALPHTRKIKSGYSTDAESVTELLTKISPESDGAAFLGALAAYRDNIKLVQTVEGLQKAAADDGRVHTTFQQGAASTGRLSSTAPNLQNIPIRTEEGRRIRGAFIVAPAPVEGVEYEGLLTADYSQIEMRIMVHLAADEKLIAAYEAGEDLHRYVGSEVFGVAPEDVTPEQRSKVKAMSYGLAYGLSRFGLAKQLNISSDEAGELRTNYFKRFGRVGRFLRGVLKQAHQDGYTETIFGRRRVLPDLDSPNRVRREAAERAALNAPIQGTAADIIKIAMINIHRRLREEGLKTRMLLQVHDEIILEVATGEREAAERVLVEEMSGAASLRVPLDVQVGWGKSWQEAGH